MRYYVTVDGETLEVDLSGERPVVDGHEAAAELARVGDTSTLNLLLDGRSHTVVAERRERHVWELHVDGERYEARVVDERTQTIQAMAGPAAAARGPKPVRAPMPGLVVRVAVEPGERVEAGQSIVIMEAMKMENDLKAETAGVVDQIPASAGQAVEKGAVLVTFREEQADG